ncbi:ankyrin repeat-containing domain protein [Aspergillus insuetus]
MTSKWEERKAEIEHLYLENDMKLSELMEYMSQGRGFNKTKSQYERQLRKWGFQKNQYLPRDFDWNFVGKRIEKRKQLQGKESELLINGKPKISDQSEREKENLIQHLRWVVPCSHPVNWDMNTRLSTTLSILMPEEYEGQHQALATNSWGLGLYLLSNGLGLSHAGVKTAEDVMSQDQRVIGLLRRFRWNKATALKTLIKDQYPSARAILESLFASALRLGDLGVVRMLLDARLDPNCPLETICDTFTPLQYAADMEIDKTVKLVQLHLSHGANVNSRHGGVSALFYAARSNNIKVIRIFLHHGAVVDLMDLAEAAMTVSEELFEELSALCSTADGIYYAEHGMLGSGYTTVIGTAAASGKPEITNYFDVAEILLRAGTDVKVADNGTRTLLELAASQSSLEGCRTLLDNGASVNRPFSEGKQPMSALFVAVQCHFTELVELLIGQVARLDDEYSQAPGGMLAEAIENGNLTIIRMFQDAGASFVGPGIRWIASNTTAQYLDSSGTLQDILDTCGTKILIRALYQGKFELARWLIGQDVDVLKAEPDGNRTPLGAAARMGELLVMETILRRGAKVTDYELTEAVDGIQNLGSPIDVLQRLLRNFAGQALRAVALASYGDRTDLAQLLLAGGVNPTGPLIGDSGGWSGLSKEYADYYDFSLVYKPQSALELAAQGLSASTLGLLLQSYSWPPDLIGRALAAAVNLPGMWESSPQKTPACIDLEIFTAIQVAVRYQRVFIVRRLLENPDVDVNCPAKGARGRTALQHAVANGNIELIIMLLSREADVNGSPAELEGATALQLASTKGYLGLARLLIDRGAQINALGAKYKGRTALEGAAKYGRIDMLQLLLSEGASIVRDAGDRQYKEAVELAKRNGHYTAVKLVESWMGPVDPTYLGAGEDPDMFEEFEDDGIEDSDSDS